MKKILLVDDDLDILKVLRTRLEASNYQILSAASAIEAFGKLIDPDLGLIILDVMMPEMNGYDFCNTIKFESSYKDIPVLFLTARDQEVDPRISKMMGIDYMHKPYNDEELLSKVKKLIGF